MIIEFQVSASKLLTLFRSRLYRGEFCAQAITPVWLLDRVVIGNLSLGIQPQKDGADKKLDAPRLPRLALPVQILIVASPDAQAAGAEAAKPRFVLHKTLLFDLSVGLADDGVTGNKVPQFSLTYGGTESGTEAEDIGQDHPLYPLIKGEMDKQFNEFSFSPQVSSFDLAAIGELIGSAVAVINAGIAVSQDNSFVAIRIEVGQAGEDSVQRWTEFYKGNIENNLAQADWSYFIDQALIVSVLVQRVGKVLHKPGSFEITSGPSGSWLTPNGLPVIDIKLSGKIIDACTCAWGEIDLAVDPITISVGLTVPTADVFKIDINLDWDADNWGLFCCYLTAALFWPVVGGILISKYEIDWGQYMGGFFITPVGVFIAALVAASNMGPGKLDLGEGCHQINNKRIVCTWAADFESFAQAGKLTLESLKGRADGALLTGSMTAFSPAQPTLKVMVKDDPEWSYENICDSPRLRSISTIEVTDAEGDFLGICEARVIDDPKGQFSDHLTVEESKVTINVPFSDLRPEYLKAPYPCKVLLLTRGGARIITLSPLSGLSEEKLASKQMLLEVMRNRPGVCFDTGQPGPSGGFDYFWLKQDDSFGDFGPMPDPEPDPIRDAHFWQVILTGVESDEMVTFLNGNDEPLASLAPTLDGVVQFSAFTTPLRGAKELSVIHSKGGERGDFRGRSASGSLRPATMNEQRQIRIKRILLRQEAVLHLSSECRELSAGRFRAVPAIFAVTATGLNIYDVTRPNFPNLIHQVQASGLEGVITTQSGLVIWGRSGLMLLSDLPATSSPRAITEMGRPVMDVAQFDRYLYALHEQTLAIYDASLKKVSELSLEGVLLRRAGRRLSGYILDILDAIKFFFREVFFPGRHAVDPRNRANHLAVARNTLAISNGYGITLFKLGNSTQPKVIGFQKVEEVIRLSDSQNDQSPIFAYTRAGARAINISSTNKIAEAGEFYKPPWLVNLARTRRIVARLNEERSAVTIYTIKGAFQL